MTDARREVGRQQQAVIAAVAQALKAKRLPPLDERLKSIVASQIRTVLKGGWPQEEVARAATDLALAWDERRGHNRLCHLAQRMRLLDADRKQREHLAQMAREKADVGAMKGVELIAGRPSPTTHGFLPAGSDKSSCHWCGGPWGVHVKPRVDVA